MRLSDREIGAIKTMPSKTPPGQSPGSKLRLFANLVNAR